MRSGVLVPILGTLAAIGLAAPAAAQSDGAQWSLRGDDASMTLAYEMPDTDDVRLAMNCDRGTGRVELWRIAWVRATPEFRLSSGAARALYRATLDDDDLPSIRGGTARTRDPVLRRFAATGELTLTVDGSAVRMNASRPQRQEIARFFRHCG